MQKTIYMCDKCGKELTRETMRYYTVLFGLEHHETMKKWKYEVCEECREKIKKITEDHCEKLSNDLWGI